MVTNLVTAGLSAALGKKVVIEEDSGSTSVDDLFIDVVSAIKSIYVWHQKDFETVAVIVKSCLGRTCYLGINLNETVRCLEEKIRDRQGLQIDEIRLTHDGCRMEDNACLKVYNIGNNDTIDMIVAMGNRTVNLRVISETAQTYYIEMNLEETVEQLKDKIEHKVEIPSIHQSLEYNGTQLHDDKYLKEYDLKDDDIIKVGGSMDYTKTDVIFICLKTLKGGAFCNYVAVDPHYTVRSLKRLIRYEQGIPLEEQNLIFNGRHLEDARGLWEYGIKTNDVIQVLLRLRGGGSPADVLKITAKEFDPSYDYTYATSGKSGENFTRGARNFQRPYGWTKTALKVIGKYEDDNWLGSNSNRANEEDSVPNEWPVSYHGTSVESANPIAQQGYDINKGQRFKYGRGIYSSPTPIVAEGYATQFDFEGSPYKMIFMNRFNFSDTKEHDDPVGIYLVTANDRNVRPYALLFKKLN